MLALKFSQDEYAFVYTMGRPIGAILVGEKKGRGQLSLLFSGSRTDFEVLRPQTVELRFGRDELTRLESQFLLRAHNPRAIQTAGSRAKRCPH
jgi:hypothetical protein